jgi:hypothetical protein
MPRDRHGATAPPLAWEVLQDRSGRQAVAADDAQVGLDVVVGGVECVAQQAVVGGLWSTVGLDGHPQRPPVQLLGQALAEGGYVLGSRVCLDRDLGSPTMAGV